jgi:hypothetical protein
VVNFTKQTIAAVRERRLTNSEFITVAAAADRGTPQASFITPRGLLSLNLTRETVSPEDQRRYLDNSRSVVGGFIDEACAAAAAGHVFDMGSLATLERLFGDGLTSPPYKAFEAERLVVPCSPGTLFVMRGEANLLPPAGMEKTTGGVPLGVYITAAESGGPMGFTGFTLTTSGDGLAYDAVSSFVLHGDPERPGRARVLPTAFHADGRMDEDAVKLMHHAVLFIGLAALLLVNDDRLEFRCDVPAAALNKSRVKSGKPPLPSVWRMPKANAVADYITKFGGKSKDASKAKDGMHASPVQHEGRRHLRLLPSGPVTKERPSLVGGLENHLTRTRAFYEAGK